MHIEVKSLQPDSIVSMIMIRQDIGSPNVWVRAHCRDRASYLRLKGHLGERPYYSDEGNSMFSDEYCISLNSSNGHLIRYFIDKILDASPSLGRVKSLLRGYAPMWQSMLPYSQASEIPAWDIVDKRNVASYGTMPCVQINNNSINRKCEQIRFLFDWIAFRLNTVCIKFCENAELNELQENLNKVDSDYWSRKRDFFDGTVVISVNTPAGRLRLAQFMTALLRFDPNFNLELVTRINSLLPLQDRFEVMVVTPPLRFQSSATSSIRPTLTEQIHAVRHHPENLKKILDSMGDTLLKGKPSNAEDYIEFERACEYLVENNRTQFCNLFFEFYAASYKNKDDLQYILEKRRFHWHFLFSQPNALDPENSFYLELKNRHIHILNTILGKNRGSRQIDANFSPNASTQEAEDLRAALRKESVLSYKLANIALSILAKYWPINPEDYTTLELIAPQDRFFATNGHQYDRPILMQYNATRLLRYDLNETQNNRQLIAPVPNSPFEKFDAEQINMLNTDSFFTNNDLNPLESLYDLQFRKRVDEIKETLTYHPNGYNFGLFYNNNVRVRLARLPEALQTRLLENILKSKQYMIGAIEALTNAGLSVEQFAALETDKQFALCDVLNNINQPKFDGLNVRGLIMLSAENIKRLFSHNSWAVNDLSIGELNNQIISMRLDEQDEKNNQPRIYVT